MNCPEPDLLQQLVDDVLPAEMRDQLERHLDLCSDCQKHVDSSAETQVWRNALLDLNTRASESSLLENVLSDVKSRLDPWKQDEPGQSTHSGISSDALAWTNDGFELIDVLGQGGMGIVFKARESSLNRVVAVKVLSPAFAADPSARERFLREARAAAAINHPNVVTIHAVSDSGPLPYLVMEYVAGTTLQDRLDEAGVLDVEEIVRISVQVAAALSAAHSSGVLHRDVKPANIFVGDDNDRVKLGDFGLAQVVGQSQLTKTGMLAGTPTYVAPETLEPTAKPDHRADLFSLGSVMYAMCCGRPPFEGDSVLATLHQVANSQPTPIVQLNSTVPRRLGNTISKLHAKDPALRFQSAAELQTALEGQTPVSMEPVPPPIGLAVDRLHHKRRVSRAGLLGVVCVFAAVLAVLALTSAGSSGSFSVYDDEGEFVGSFASLAEAADFAPNSSRIEIRGDGPYFVGGLTLPQQVLTLVAAEGFEPELRFVPDVNHEEDQALLIAEGDLSLAGLSLVCDVGEEVGFPSLIHATEGALHAESCRFIIGPEGSCLAGNMEHSVVLFDCELHAGGGDCIVLLTEEEGRAELEDCLLTGGVAIRMPDLESCEVALVNCTFVAHQVFELFNEEADLTADVSPTFVTENCVFKAFDAVMAINVPGTSREAFSRQVNWRGERNVFSGPMLSIVENESHEIASWCESVEDWTALTDEIDPTYSDELFSVADEELWELIDDPEELDTEIFERDDKGGKSPQRPFP